MSLSVGRGDATRGSRRDVHREAIVALLIFQRACEEERLTVELVQQLAAYLRRERRG